MNAAAPDLVLETLKSGAGQRTVRNLEKVHGVCRAIHQAGGRDYSLASIGRRSQECGGPTAGTLYTVAGKPFRELIAAWAKHAGAAPAPATPPAEDVWLRRIPDPADRALIGMLIAERNRLRHEVNLLKAHASVIVDRRPAAIEQVGTNGASALDGLVPTEREALAKALSAEWLDEHGLKISAHGAVLNDHGRELLPIGFVPGLRKLLGAGQTSAPKPC